MTSDTAETVSEEVGADVPVILLRDVSKTFSGPREVLALRDVNLTVDKGDYISLIGPSGAGKSTLLNIIGLLDSPTIGSYELNGILTTTLSDTERSHLRGRALGFVFQSFHLLNRRSVFENVLLGMAYSDIPKTDRYEMAAEALATVGLEHRSDFRPGTLSGGERQRVALARAIAGKPSVLLADEPTGNLDQGSSGGIMDSLDDLNSAGLTLMVITHDSNVAKRANRTVSILDGRLSE